MPDPITTVLNSGDPEQLEALVTGIMNRQQTAKAAILQNRAATFGTLTKSFQDREPDRYDKLDRVFRFFQASAQKDTQMLRKLQDENLAAAKTYMADAEYKALVLQVEGTSADGGYSVPPEFAADLARVLGAYGYARQYGRVWQMASNVLNIAQLATKPTVAWVGENAAIASSKATEGQTVLTTNKLAAIWVASNEFVYDVNFDIYNVILELFAEQFAFTEDNVFFRASNTTFRGLMYYAAQGANTAVTVYRGGSSTSGKTSLPQIGTAAADDDSWTDLLRLIDGQNMSLTRGGRIFIDQRCWIGMLAQKDSNKRYIVDLINSGLSMSTGFAGTPEWYFHGYPLTVLPTGVMLTYTTAASASTPYAIFGNLKAAWATLGTRGGFAVKVLEEGTVDSVSLAEKDLVGLRMTERLAMNCALPAFLNILSTSAS
jgi:HK97 family phage major capsid protein